MKRSFLLLLIIVGSFFIASCADDPVVPGIDLKLTRVVFETAKNTGLIADVEASINHADRSVLAQINGGELSALEPSFYAIGASSSEPTGRQDFSNPVFYNIISRDGFSSLGYMVTVLPGGDAYDVSASRQWLEVGYATGESSTAVSNNVTLANISTNGCTISWQSSGTNIVVSGTSGAVYRPPFSAGNVSVTLTATISKGNASTTKTFTLLIIRQGITDQERVNEDVGAATIGYAGGDSATSITKDLTLPASGTANGSTFVWTSSNTAIIANDGVVTRPDYGPAGDALVTLHLRGTKNAASAERKFVDLKVLQKEDPAITNVAAVKAALAVGYAAGESASAVTNNVTLPTSINGVAISWASSIPGTITTGGAVTQPTFTAGNATVTLTATLSQTTFVGSPERTGIKTFTLTVIKLPPSDPEAVAATKAALAIVYSTGESAAAIKNDLTLATSGLYGATVAWASSIPATISTTGVVTRPSYSDGDATVNLTATITRSQDSSASDEKVFSGQIVIKNVPVTADEKISAETNRVAISYQTGDSAASITKNITLLPASTTNAGVTVTWSVVSGTAIVVNGTTGEVTRPALELPDDVVVLRASVSCSGGTTKDIDFTGLTVKALGAFIPVFAGSDFESSMSLTKESTITHTWTNSEFKAGAKSLRVKGTLSGNGKLMTTGLICNPRGSYTKVTFWIKGTGAGAKGSLSIYQLVSTSKYYLLGTKTDDNAVNGEITLTEGGDNSYNGDFTFNSWTKIILPLSGDPSGRAFDIRGGKGGTYDFYIDNISYE